MPVITRKNLVAKNSAGSGIKMNGSGSNKANNQAVKKLAELLDKAAKQIGEDDAALQDNIAQYSVALNDLTSNLINQNTAPKINRALKTMDGFDHSLNFYDNQTKRTTYQTIVETLPSIGSSKEEFDSLLATANGVLELGLEKSVIKPVDPAEAERQRQEQERQRQEQERQRQEQERQRLERERLEQERIRAERVARLGVVGAFKADGSTQYAAAIMAQKNGAIVQGDPIGFINGLHAEAQWRLDVMNRFPSSGNDAEKRKAVVSILRDTERLLQSASNAPKANAGEDEKRRYIEQTAGDIRMLQSDYYDYRRTFAGSNVKPKNWPDAELMAEDSKPSLDSLYNDKDENFAKKFIEQQDAVEKQKLDQLKSLLEEKPLKAEEISYEQVEIPGKEAPTVEEAYKYFYGLDGLDTDEDLDQYDPVQMAVDSQGNAYTDRDEIIKQLSVPGKRLFVFRKDGSLPRALINQNGKLSVSNEEISSLSQLPGKSAGLFEPKKSLDPRDIANIPSHREIDALKRAKEDPAAKNKYADDWIAEGERIKRESQDWLKNNRKKGPKLGAFRTLQRWAYKAVTFGQGETNAYRKYQERKKRWLNKVSTHEMKIQAMDKRTAAMKQAKLDTYKFLKAADDKLAQLRQDYYSKKPELQKQNIQEYRRRTEVRMEGIADIIRNGKVTQDNVFANTWLAEQNCKGKTLEDPGALNNLVSYIASRKVEEVTLDETIKDPEYSRSRNSMMVEGLNNGQAADSIRRSGIFNKMLQEQGDKPIDPDQFYKEYEKRAQEREKRFSDPLNKLKNARMALINDFGEKPITEECIYDISKLIVIDKNIRSLEETERQLKEIQEKQKEMALHGEQLSFEEKARLNQLTADKERGKDHVKEILSGLGSTSKRAHISDFNKYRSKEYKDSLKTVQDNLQNAGKKIDESGLLNGLSDDQKLLINSNVNVMKTDSTRPGAKLSVRQTFRLDEMTDMVNRTVEHNREIQQKNQPKGKDGPTA